MDEAALAECIGPGASGGSGLGRDGARASVGVAALWTHNVILTPHTSFYSEESLVDLQTKAAEEVVRVLTGEAPTKPGESRIAKSGLKSDMVVSQYA